MSDGKVIEFADVTMVFGDVPAVDGLTARVDPGHVTAFLGPNGAGKTTTLRVLLGELRPSRGRATIGGSEYQRIARPAASIGAVMSLLPLDKARRKTVAKYLERAARRVGVGSGRVREVLTIVGLAEMADMRIGNLSLGMKHRLAVAEALLGDPSVLVFDEPANGLDPEGIRWIRLLMRRFADEGRTVLMSSHVLSEVEQVADALLVLNQGSLLFEGPIELLSDAEGGPVTVDADDRDELLAALDEAGLDYRVLRSGVTIDNTTTTEVGSLAARRGLALTTLTHRGPSLEDIYLRIIDGTWTAPARTAALAPTALAAAGDGSHDGDIAGIADGNVEHGAADVGGDGPDEDPADSADGPDGTDDGPQDSDPADADGGDPADVAGTADDAEFAPSSADAEAAPDDSHDSGDDSDDADRTGVTAPDAPHDSGDDSDDEDPTDGADVDAMHAQRGAAAVDAPEGDDAAPATATPAGAGASLPGIVGLAGLAQGLRSGDDSDGDEDDPSAGAVSPALRAAFERAGELERDADTLESEIETQEARVDAEDDWEAQLRAMFDDESAEPSATSDGAFPTANFDVPRRD